MALTPEDQDREASIQDSYRYELVCQTCLYFYQMECRHSHGPLAPNKGACGGKVQTIPEKGKVSELNKGEDMNTKIDWDANRFGDGVLCELRPRETYQGRPLKSSIAQKAGARFVLVTQWKMDNDDPYPGEYALSTKSCAQLLAELGLTWIASGDVVVIGESPGGKP